MRERNPEIENVLIESQEYIDIKSCSFSKALQLLKDTMDVSIGDVIERIVMRVTELE